MSIPPILQKGLKLPLVVAPMFLVSGPDLVVNSCCNGAIGTFPALNQRTSEGFEQWLIEIKQRLKDFEDKGGEPAPFGVNLIVHKTNPRLQADLALCVKHEVPLIITSLGAVPDVVEAVHGYGGVVFHDVISVRHGQKAAEAGVDGLIAVCAGAGGHAGIASPFALIKELRAIFDKTILLSGAMTSGSDIVAAEAMGADLAYLGTRFIATKESMAKDTYKNMLIESYVKDIVYTDKISGVMANFLTKSLEQAGVDLTKISGVKMDMENEARAWSDVWSAGHGVGSIHDSPSVEELISRIGNEYLYACQHICSKLATSS